jgi:TRAP-type C4-dicarboxylate transport system substrate-binding protein
MKHSGLIASIACALVVVVLIGGCKSAEDQQEKKVIKLQYANFPPASTFPCVQMEHWKEQIEERTEGKVEVQTFPGSTLLNPKTMLDGVVSGRADIGCLAMSYMPGRFPVSEAVDMPVGIPSAEVGSLVLFDLIQKYKPAEFGKVKIITMFTCPPSSFMTRDPVATLEDMKGMQLRASATGVDVVKRLGATPVAMPMSDTPDAVQKGVVSGVVSSLEVLKDMNFAAYCPHATRTDIYVVTFAVVMNKDKWEALPDDVKKVIDDMAREQAQWTGKYVDAHVEEAIVWAAAERNHTMHELTEAEHARIRELMAPMLEEYVARTDKAGLQGQKILDDVRSIMAAVVQETE